MCADPALIRDQLSLPGVGARRHLTSPPPIPARRARVEFRRYLRRPISVGIFLSISAAAPATAAAAAAAACLILIGDNRRRWAAAAVTVAQSGTGDAR